MILYNIQLYYEVNRGQLNVVRGIKISEKYTQHSKARLKVGLSKTANVWIDSYLSASKEIDSRIN